MVDAIEEEKKWLGDDDEDMKDQSDESEDLHTAVDRAFKRFGQDPVNWARTKTDREYASIINEMISTVLEDEDEDDMDESE